jgi:hypothetical protein
MKPPRRPSPLRELRSRLSRARNRLSPPVPLATPGSPPDGTMLKSLNRPGRLPPLPETRPARRPPIPLAAASRGLPLAPGCTPLSRPAEHLQSYPELARSDGPRRRGVRPHTARLLSEERPVVDRRSRPLHCPPPSKTVPSYRLWLPFQPSPTLPTPDRHDVRCADSPPIPPLPLAAPAGGLQEADHP